MTDARLMREFEKLHKDMSLRYGSRTLYEALGVWPDATETDIIGKFREKAFEYHPDRNNASEAEQRFKDVNAVYQILSDPSKRAAYDSWLRLYGYLHKTRPGTPREAASQQATGRTANAAYPSATAHDGKERDIGGYGNLEDMVKAYVYGKVPFEDFMRNTRGMSAQQYDLVDKFLGIYFEKRRQEHSREVFEQTEQMIREIERIRLETLRTIMGA